MHVALHHRPHNPRTTRRSSASRTSYTAGALRARTIASARSASTPTPNATTAVPIPMRPVSAEAGIVVVQAMGMR